MSPSAACAIADWAPAAAPPPALTVSEWADAKRMLPETSGSRGAPWRTDTTPYLRGIMDSVHEIGVRKIAIEKCAQSGGSEALHNILGYFIEHDPCAMLFVHPTAGVAEEWSKERLADMIRSTPALSDVVRDKREKGSHEAESTLSLKLFPGGFLALGGANTPNTFARRSVRVAIGDDCDRFPAVVADEGDPADLLVNRTTTFHDALAIFVSTPTLKGGRIDTMYSRSDQRRFFVTCPSCGREDWITWNDPKHFRVAFDDNNPETASIACPDEELGGCSARLHEADRRRMIMLAAKAPDHGWRPTAIAQDTGLIGFHLPAMISTLGNVTLPYLVEKWFSARARGKESLRVFINTSLAEGWEDRTARVESHTLMTKREDYGEGVEVPAPAVCLTAFVDVQEDRFELQVQGWGHGSERWVVDWRAVLGDPKQDETQVALLEALTRKYVHASGHQLPIHGVCIDTGYATDEMYDFVLAHQAKRIFATKGFAGKAGEPIVGKPSERRTGRSARPVRLYPINVDDAKADIINGLALDKGPGSIHFPAHLDTINEEYFAQLCSEHRETRYNVGGVATHTVWVKHRERNEALDTAVGCLAALRLLHPNIRQMADVIASTALPPADDGNGPDGATPPPAPAAPKPGRRFSRSSYLDR